MIPVSNRRVDPSIWISCLAPTPPHREGACYELNQRGLERFTSHGGSFVHPMSSRVRFQSR